MNEKLSRANGKSPTGRKIRVMLVDDSSPALTALAGLLERLPTFEVTDKVTNSLDGLALADQLRPDLVITDLQMPGLDGLQLAKRLRAKHPAMRLVIISAHDGPVCRAISLQHGADAFLGKQRLVEELPDLLTKLFPGAAGYGMPNNQA